MKRSYRMLIVPALAAGLLAAPLLAQTTTSAPKPSERNAPASAQPSQAVDGAEARARLNAQQAQAAQAQVANNSMSEAEYQRQLKAVEDAKIKIAADAAKARADYDALVARQAADHAAAMERWRADVAACEAGDATRCGPPVVAAAE